MNTLNFPTDLHAWQAWQLAQRGLKARVKNGLSHLRRVPPRVVVTVSDPHECDVLVALDATTPTAIRALVRPLAFLDDLAVTVVAPGPVTHLLPPRDWQEAETDLASVSALASTARTTIGLGHYFQIGAAAHQGAAPARFLTVQHGLLTPHAPPLAPNTRLLAWSQADAEFWRSGRRDTTSIVVGSQLLWEAAANAPAAPHVAESDRTVYLGQLHGAELDRHQLALSAERFCREHHAIYRPHPSEKDRKSRAQHRKWAASGIDIDSGTTPLSELNAPVVSAFSTGILEAAAKGVPAWAYHSNPPDWLREFWERYGIHTWGETPTPPSPQPDIEPAQAIANIVLSVVEER